MRDVFQTAISNIIMFLFSYIEVFTVDGFYVTDLIMFIADVLMMFILDDLMMFVADYLMMFVPGDLMILC